MNHFKVGEIAKATGITVRALHHYEEIGLLEPSFRSESGHRLYSESDLMNLQQILLLKQLGFPLEDIRKCLLEKTPGPLEIVRLHQKRIRDESEQLDRLREQLAILERALADNRELSVQQLLTTIEVIYMHEKYFTKEQLEEIKTRSESQGREKMESYGKIWAQLIDKVRAEANKKTNPLNPEVQKLAQEWNALVRQFSGGDIGIETQLSTMYRKEPSMREKAGMDAELYEYVSKMMTAYYKLK